MEIFNEIGSEFALEMGAGEELPGVLDGRGPEVARFHHWPRYGIST